MTAPPYKQLTKIIKFANTKTNKMKESILSRITLDPEICHGKPVIRDTRHLVEGIIEYLAGGDTIEDILKEYPELSREDVLACLAFAARAIQLKDITLPAA